jgi:hypothetical protein
MAQPQDTWAWLGVARGSERICESFLIYSVQIAFCRSQMVTNGRHQGVLDV